MRQMQIMRFGGPDELTEAQAPVPAPGPGEVVIRVLTAGVNPIDFKMRDGSSGRVQNVTPADFPLVLGREACGEVVALGHGVRDLAVGDVVFGVAPMAHWGRCYAEYAALPAECLALAPAGADPVLLGGLSLVGSTACVALDQARVGADDIVLIHGGAGGVGQVAVQLCRQRGAEVWATASTGNQDLLETAGAHPIDYTQQRFEDACPRPTVIIDGAYFATFERSLDHLAEGGRIVALPTLADLTGARERGIEAHIPTMIPHPVEMRAFAERVLAGQAVFEVSRTYALDEVAEAHRQLETGHVRGKLVLDLR